MLIKKVTHRRPFKVVLVLSVRIYVDGKCKKFFQLFLMLKLRKVETSSFFVTLACVFIFFKLNGAFKVK